MVQHRHILSATADLPTFLQQIRNKLKCLIREGILLQMIKSGEKLYDMNCIKGIKTEGTALIIIGKDIKKYSRIVCIFQFPKTLLTIKPIKQMQNAAASDTAFLKKQAGIFISRGYVAQFCADQDRRNRQHCRRAFEILC